MTHSSTRTLLVSPIKELHTRADERSLRRRDRAEAEGGPDLVDGDLGDRAQVVLDGERPERVAVDVGAIALRVGDPQDGRVRQVLAMGGQGARAEAASSTNSTTTAAAVKLSATDAPDGNAPISPSLAGGQTQMPVSGLMSSFWATVLAMLG